MNDNPALTLSNVTKHFKVTGRRGKQQVVKAVDGVSLQVTRGKTLGLVGESGSGKSTVARLAAGLLEPTAGDVLYGETSINGLTRGQMRGHRSTVQMVFQDPYSSLDPRFTVSQILAEPLIVAGWPRERIRGLIPTLLARVGLPEEAKDRTPGSFSGGQRQRIGIARATALSPEVLVLDEPVSALDASIQAQVLNLFRQLQSDLNIGYLFIGHDLAVVRHMADELAVMYLGTVVEQGPTNALLDAPSHPYTQALVSAVPVRHPAEREERERIVLKGEIPSPTNPPTGCRFRTRCWLADDRCAQEVPLLVARGGNADRLVACHYPESRSILHST